ncbi:hypothetical protein [Brenneria corticis]|uniref:hypothetical protein n=1 Tax=Brenneria corticis TaxID=2173106 RepID=UPI00143DA505|nr:hypothetical protein [Brenneria sp. CFCC 11842]
MNQDGHPLPAATFANRRAILPMVKVILHSLLQSINGVTGCGQPLLPRDSNAAPELNFQSLRQSSASL